MSNWLIEQTLFFSAMALLLCLAAKPLIYLLGARGYYWLWAVIPAQLMLSFIAGPSQVPVPNEMMSYVVNANNAVQGTHIKLLSKTDMIVSVWLTGTALCGLFALLMHRAFQKNLALTPLSVKDLDVTPQFQAAFINSRNVRFATSAKIRSPMLFGVRKATIVLPLDFSQSSAVTRELMIRHELIHLQRHDLAWNILALALLCLFWFNPLAWMAFKQFRNAQEMSCDSEVLTTADKATKLTYARAFVAQSLATHPYSLTTLHYGGKDNMKARLNNLKRNTSLTVLTLPFAAVLLTLAFGFQVISAEPPPPPPKLTNDVRPVFRVEPMYPKEAADLGIEGQVVLQFNLTTDGIPTDIQVIESLPNGEFSKSATAAVKKWRYNPVKETQYDLRIRLDYSLGNDEDVETLTVRPNPKM